AGLQAQFIKKKLEVVTGAAPVRRNNPVAGTEKADVLAKGNMHVKRYRAMLVIALCQHAPEVIDGDLLVVTGRRRVRRIARAVHPVALNEVRIPACHHTWPISITAMAAV